MSECQIRLRVYSLEFGVWWERILIELMLLVPSNLLSLCSSDPLKYRTIYILRTQHQSWSESLSRLGQLPQLQSTSDPSSGMILTWIYFTDNPFLVTPNHSTYFAILKQVHNFCILYNDSQSASTSGSCTAYLSYHHPPSNSSCFSPPSSHHISPYDKEWRRRSGNSFYKPPLCLQCSSRSHWLSEC